MGTKVHHKSYLPGYYSMRDLNEDSYNSSWPLWHGDKAVTNGYYYNNGFIPGTTVDGAPGYDKDTLRQKMLEHEAVFKNQVFELHRLYRIQRDMMQEVGKNELHSLRASIELSSSSSLQGSRVPPEDAQKLHMASFPVSNYGYSQKSTSGVEIINSPMSCTRGYSNAPPSRSTFQNGSTSKDCEASGSRPLKVRKKLFDLELPADEYIDTEEGGKLKSVGLADLNEPVQLQDTTAPLYVDFLGHGSKNGEIKGKNELNKSNACYLGVNGSSVHIHDGFLINSSIENKVLERGRLSNIYEAGSGKSTLGSLSRGIQQDKLPVPSHQVQGMLNPVHHASGIYQIDHSREDNWRERNHNGSESSYKNRQPFISSNLESASRGASFFSSSCFSGSQAQPVSSWANPTSSSIQKMDSSLQHAAPCQEPFGSRWRVNSCTGSESRKPNGFYHGSASGSNEPRVHLPSSGFDYFNCSRGENDASNSFTNHGIVNFQKGPCHQILRPAIDINLNKTVPKRSLDEADRRMVDGKSMLENHLSALSWLRCKNERVRDLNQPVDISDCEIVDKNQTPESRNVKKILGIPIFALKKEPSSPVATTASVGYSVNKERKNQIIDINLECEPDELVAAENPTAEKEKLRNGTSIRDHIDLNSCVSDCEDPSAPSYESKSSRVKATLEIDLEAPVLVGSEDDNNTISKEDAEDEVSLQRKYETTQDEVLRNAAEALFAISSFCPKTEDSDFHPAEATLEESLLWFVDAVSSCADELASPKTDQFPEEIDDFEAMTLQLEETKEEDYMNISFVPKVHIVEETGPTRGRRGQARRGRQRRDFQRDILPGLTSLSRHEVNEDIQIFGGLMRATGHHWTSGMTRRNGGGRGRRRAVVETAVPAAIRSPVCSAPLIQQLNRNVVGLEDRSLTGWGKTTRRPRRQRCPAGNIATVVLT